MTEGSREIAQCAEALQLGMAADAEHERHAEQVTAAVTGSGVTVEQPVDIAVPGIGTGGEPPAVSPQPGHSPNIVDPLDTSQSYGP